VSVADQVRMANDIALHMAHLDDDDAADQIAAHLNSFWDPRMRAQLLAHIAEGAPDLNPRVVRAAAKLN